MRAKSIRFANLRGSAQSVTRALELAGSLRQMRARSAQVSAVLELLISAPNKPLENNLRTIANFADSAALTAFGSYLSPLDLAVEGSIANGLGSRPSANIRPYGDDTKGRSRKSAAQLLLPRAFAPAAEAIKVALFTAHRAIDAGLPGISTGRDRSDTVSEHPIARLKDRVKAKAIVSSLKYLLRPNALRNDAAYPYRSKAADTKLAGVPKTTGAGGTKNDIASALDSERAVRSALKSAISLTSIDMRPASLGVAEDGAWLQPKPSIGANRIADGVASVVASENKREKPSPSHEPRLRIAPSWTLPGAILIPHKLPIPALPMASMTPTRPEFLTTAKVGTSLVSKRASSAVQPITLNLTYAPTINGDTAADSWSQRHADEIVRIIKRNLSREMRLLFR